MKTVTHWFHSNPVWWIVADIVKTYHFKTISSQMDLGLCGFFFVMVFNSNHWNHFNVSFTCDLMKLHEILWSDIWFIILLLFEIYSMFIFIYFLFFYFDRQKQNKYRLSDTKVFLFLSNIYLYTYRRFVKSPNIHYNWYIYTDIIQTVNTQIYRIQNTINVSMYNIRNVCYKYSDYSLQYY